MLADPTIEDPSEVTSVALCSGKVRWDLVNARGPAGKAGKTAIVAVERLYPLPAKEIADELSRFDNVEEVRWVQDEPANQGAWPFMALNLPEALAAEVPGRTWTAHAGDPAGVLGPFGRLRQGARVAAEGPDGRGFRLRCISPIAASRNSSRVGVTTKSLWRGSLTSSGPSST